MNSNRKLGNMANNFLDGHSEEVKHTKYAVSTTTTLNNMTTFIRYSTAIQGLCISITDDKVNPFYALCKHMIDGVASTATNTNDFDDI